MVNGDRVVDRLQERGVVARVLGAEDVEPDQAGARCDALDADVAGPGDRVRSEVGDVVHLAALGGDRGGVAERLLAAGRDVQALAAEVLVVHEHVLAVGADEVGIVDVQPVGDEPDRDAAAVEPERAGGGGAGHVRVGVDRLERLGIELHVARRGANTRVNRPACRSACSAVEAAGAGTEMNDLIRHDLADRGVGPQPRLLARGDGRRQRVQQRVGAEVRGARRHELGANRRLAALDRATARGLVPARRRQPWQLIPEHDDHSIGRPLTAGCRSRKRHEPDHKQKRCDSRDARRQPCASSHGETPPGSCAEGVILYQIFAKQCL